MRVSSRADLEDAAIAVMDHLILGTMPPKEAIDALRDAVSASCGEDCEPARGLAGAAYETQRTR